MVDEPDWTQAKCCRRRDDLFFPERGDAPRSTASRAKAVCNGSQHPRDPVCPVREACGEYAIATNERFGVWGGMSQQELTREKRKRRAVLALTDDSIRVNHEKRVSAGRKAAETRARRAAEENGAQGERDIGPLRRSGTGESHPGPGGTAAVGQGPAPQHPSQRRYPPIGDGSAELVSAGDLLPARGCGAPAGNGQLPTGEDLHLRNGQSRQVAELDGRDRRAVGAVGVSGLPGDVDGDQPGWLRVGKTVPRRWAADRGLSRGAAS